ncbi:tRNA guanosine(34) transglycosylase Tgt [Acidithrix ferrooxidans]|uniref:Queuine tRNA-ribosyltransferase n=2 Tax=root TaxID=1 RepID=A0A0D8HG02_9ACTN|nr:tRNA guanosine(34) transglycosylase Tgt [Acidithrix ferrooxidans]KJF16875.1 queuine tRNA-ribosyltransferase [Acidithrix ferrooxidans]
MVDDLKGALSFSVGDTHNGSRRGTVKLNRGSFSTPIFMPVGTRGTIKAAIANDIAAIGFEVILGNTYHLMLRPGVEVIDALGGLGRFSGWKRSMLTDSGGFQVMSLGATFSDGGATFRSIYDGSIHDVTPEKAVWLQEMIGADIAMVLDVCTNLPASRDEIKRAMDLTHSWALRARFAKHRQDQAQFGIVQGGSEVDLRSESAKFISDVGFEGIALGGLAVGESRDDMLRAIDAVVPHLPPDKPRYLMGVGDPIGVVEAIARGIDMFDCVAPSRVARHGVAMTFSGKMHMRNQKYVRDESPIEPGCPCVACANFPRALIRHLVSVGEPTGGSLLTLHNLTFMYRLIEGSRNAISTKTLGEYIKSIYAAWGN